MDVLGLFATRRVELGVIEVADALRWPKSSTSRILAGMAAAGFLDRDDGSGQYRVGSRLAAVAVFAQQSASLQRLARPALERLRDETGETASLAVLAGKEMVDLEVVESLRRVRHSDWVGRHGPLHATAAGKALIAWMPPAEIRKRVTPMKRYAPRTIPAHRRHRTRSHHSRDANRLRTGDAASPSWSDRRPVGPQRVRGPARRDRGHRHRRDGQKQHGRTLCEGGVRSRREVSLPRL